MTTVELEAEKASFVREILIEINSPDLLEKLQKAYRRLKKQAAKEENNTISKEEILAGIDTGLKEMVERKKSGRKAKTLEELIDEL